MNMADDLSVKVAVRVRPLVDSEVSKGCRDILDVIPENNQIIIKRTDKDNAFSFNYVLPSESTQDQLYTICVQPLIGNLLKGYNVTIFAYGQTGSGKTHSMGTSYSGEGDAGVIPKAVHEIFDVARDNFMYDFTITVSFLELYQEVLYDLLASKPRDQCVLDIREDPTKGIHIPGLTEIPVNSAQEVLEILKKGSACRMTGSTAMNSQSSRSHAIFMVNISLNHKTDCHENKQAKLNVVDLAGSERPKKTGAVGTTFKEGVNINKGLFVLGNVISCLGDEKLQHGFIPYRDSNLTRLLKDSLGGNSITLMLACVSPADYNIEETLSTLRYADRARKIKNKPVVNQDAKVAEINDLKRTIQQLRLQIVSQGGPMVCPAELELLRKDICDLKTKIKNLTMQLSNSLIENTCLHEKIILLQTVNDTLNKKILNLKEQCDTTFSNISLGLANNDTTVIKNNVVKLQQIHTEFMQINTEQKETEQEIRFHEKAFNDHLMATKTNDHIDDQKSVEEIEEKQETHTSRQVALNMQLTEIQKQLLLKEGLAKTLLANNQHIVDVKEMAENESKIAQLEKEKKELLEKLKSAGSGKGSELYKKRIQELENNLNFLNKKVQEQARLIKLKAKDEERIGKLNQEILQMKQAKVKLVRTMREESDKFRQWKLQKERECLRLKQQDRKKETEIVRMKAMHNKQQTVFKRRVEQAEALNKRLKGALALRQQVSHSKKAGQADKIEPWLKQEYELFVDLVEAEATLTELLKDRATLQYQLSELKANPESSNECKIIEDDLELRSVQIQDLQQKILDSNEETKMKTRLEKFQTMGEAKYAISFLFSQAEKSHKEKVQLQSKLNDIQEMCNEFQEKLKSTDNNSKIIEERLKQNLVEQQKDYEEKIAILLRHRKSADDNVVINDEDTQQQMLKIQQERIQTLENEIELLKQSTKIRKPDIKVEEFDVTPQRPPKNKKFKQNPRIENIKVEEPLEDSFENVDDDDINRDPDWRKTPLGKRILEEKHRLTFIRKAEPDLPVKRSSEGGCTCKTNCSSARCGCRKLNRACGSVCKCTSCENKEELEQVEPSIDEMDDAENRNRFENKRKKKTRKLFTFDL